MASSRWAFSICVLTTAGILRPAEAQEFQVYTQVYNQRAEPKEGNRPPVIAKSLSLFHAGKVYDFMIGVGEVSVFEPARRRFTILHMKREIATSVTFEELQRLVRMAGEETEKYAAQSPAQGGPTEKVARALRFQLDPEFEESFDPEEKRFTLSSPHLSYRVRCAEAKTPEAVHAYLRYADWICRLNYVLHPQSLYPGARLQVNESLRREGLLPLEVQLQAEIAHRIHLLAEHRIGWSLDDNGRSMIDDAERTLRNPATKRVSFREYQRAVLADK